MTTEDTFETILRELGRALVALAPYGEDVIVIGGVVPVVYRHMPELPELGAVVARAASKSAEWALWIRKALALLDKLFDSETADGVIEAAHVYRGAIGSEAPTEKAVATVVRRLIAALRSELGWRSVSFRCPRPPVGRPDVVVM